jgi:anti-anti-sigma regulatory factor
MSPSTPSGALTRQEHPEATVIRIGVRSLLEGEQLLAVKETVDREVEVGSRPLVLDLAAVEYLDSAAFGWLLALRGKLVQRGRTFQARQALFGYFPDQAAALEAVRQGEPDPLMLCGIRPKLMQVFRGGSPVGFFPDHAFARS